MRQTIKCCMLCAAVAGCEYRDQPSAISIRQACYDVAAEEGVTVHVQVRTDAGNPLAGATVTWSLAPADVFSLGATSSDTGGVDLDSFHTNGVASTTVTLVDGMDASSVIGTLQAAVIIDDSFATATAALHPPAVPCEPDTTGAPPE